MVVEPQRCPDRLVAPTGAEIIGAIQALGITSTDLSTEVVRLNGSVEFEVGGTTDMDTAWNAQETLTVDGETLFKDDAGSVWRSSQLVRFADYDALGGVAAEERAVQLPSYSHLLAFWLSHQPSPNYARRRASIA